MKKQQKQATDIKKKPYQTPKLSQFGSIAGVTESHANGPSSDHGNNMMGS